MYNAVANRVVSRDFQTRSHCDVFDNCYLRKANSETNCGNIISYDGKTSSHTSLSSVPNFGEARLDAAAVAGVA